MAINDKNTPIGVRAAQVATSMESNVNNEVSDKDTEVNFSDSEAKPEEAADSPSADQ